jgi:branched-chain amino acid transport system ATP-binding protein
LANSALALHDIDAYYGDSHVLQQVSFALGEGRLLGLLGRNGAGKSTCMNVTVGLLPPRKGSVEVFGNAVTRRAPEQIAARGVALVPQGRRVFKSLTVRENLAVAARKPDPGSRHAPWTIETIFAMFPRLAERRAQIAAYLSGGEQQMLAIGRALMSKPRCLMLDEPSLGIAPILVKTIFQKIVEINQSLGITILLVEQNANLALEVSNYGYVLETGRIILQDKCDGLRRNEQVKSAYLGGS